MNRRLIDWLEQERKKEQDAREVREQKRWVSIRNWASLLGVTLRPDTGHGLRWRGQSYALRFGAVAFELCDGPQIWQWSAIVGFSQAPLRYPILGVCGCLQFLDARFLGKSQIVELEINPSYPGTTT